jgi:O-antigen/teichoic acid export membrane protein
MERSSQPKTAQLSATRRLRTHLIRGSVGSLVLQGGFAVLAFLNAIILGRLLGAGGYGAYANAVAWVNILVIPALFGFTTLLVRDVAIYRSRGEWGKLKGLLRFSNSFVLGLSVFLALILLAAAEFLFATLENNEMRLSLLIAAPLVPLLALSSLRESASVGLEYTFRARLPGLIFRPGLLMTGITLVYFQSPDYLNVPIAMAINVGAATVALAASMYWLRKFLPPEVRLAQPEYNAGTNLKVAFPMLVYGGMQVILGQTDIVMLGLMRGAGEVGLYAAASRLAFLLTFVMMAINVLVAPVTARLHANGEKERLQKIITQAVRIAFLTALPFGLILIFAGENVLSLFGDDFLAAQLALIILAVGRLVDLAMGVGTGPLVLSMTGHERVVAIIFTLAALINVALNFYLIPKYGIEGAALASMVCLFCAKVLLNILALNRLDLHVTVLGLHTRQANFGGRG